MSAAANTMCLATMIIVVCFAAVIFLGAPFFFLKRQWENAVFCVWGGSFLLRVFLIVCLPI